MKHQYLFMNVIAPSIILLPLLIAMIKLKLLPREARRLFVYLVVDAMVSVTSSVLARYNVPNTPLYHLATIVQTVLILYFFYLVLQKKAVSVFVKWAMFLFPVTGIANSIWLQPMLEFNSYTLSLQSLMIILCSFFYWWHQEDDAELKWAAIPLNWIVSGLLLYFSSSFLLFTFSNAALTYLSVENFALMWNVHAALSIIMYVLMSIGFSKYER